LPLFSLLTSSEIRICEPFRKDAAVALSALVRFNIKIRQINCNQLGNTWPVELGKNLMLNQKKSIQIYDMGCNVWTNSFSVFVLKLDLVLDLDLDLDLVSVSVFVLALLLA
jgi:hypothetical protein